MCHYQGKPVGEYCSCCQVCAEYLDTCTPIVTKGLAVGECDFDFCVYCPDYAECEEIWDSPIELAVNDSRALVMQNVRTAVREAPRRFTLTQYRILCRIIVRKKITRQFFCYILMELYGLSDWKRLNYRQMYELIHVLTFWDYGKEGNRHE